MNQEAFRQLRQKSFKLFVMGRRLFQPQPGPSSRLLLSQRGVVRRGVARSERLLTRLFGL